MKRITSIFVLLAFSCMLFFGSLVAYAGKGSGVPYSGSKEYERMKGLVGAWEGTFNMGKEGQPIRVEYRLTAGGSAIVETLFPGTPEEMISVYHDSNGELSMTHYCMLQNQPHMKLLGVGADRLDFTFSGGSNIDPKKDAHMHALTILFVDKDHIVQNWSYFEGGKEKSITRLDLSRVH
ncbi:MAG TPA: hypothetical protein VEM15_16135 [Thermodesulfobacteriota bacterium]|nr:hypothetical protein [Thermodesulfobacteriota bacterium]